MVVALNGITAADAGVPEEVRTVELHVNRGVAPGWNAAASCTDAAILVFGNDDVSLGPRSLELMYQALNEHCRAGIVGPAGSKFDFASAKHLGWVLTEDLAEGEVRRCDAVSGFLFAVRRDDFEAIGGFDEAYAPASMEEIDLAMAMRVRLGLDCRVVGGIDYQHEFGVSVARPWRRIDHNGRREFLFTIHRRNRRHFFRKWSSELCASG
jgi:GT2 family glycosyltransferase